MVKTTKVISSSNKKFVDAGKGGSMFGKQTADTQASATTGKKTAGPGGKGGKGHMFGKGSANNMRPGVTGKGSN